MEEKLKAELDALVMKHENAKAAATRATEKRDAEQDAFVRRFVEVRDRCIGPAMKEVADYLEGRGFQQAVKKTAGEPSPRGVEQVASISLIIYVGDDGERRRQDMDYPAFTYICDRSKQHVWMHERTMAPRRGGQAGIVGEPLQPEQITRELVQSRILSFLKKII